MNDALILPVEDHRTRVAREKRARTRQLLLNSIIEVCGDSSHGNSPVINDVIKHAGVSRGTFYKHFDSLEQAIAQLGDILSDEMTEGIYPIYDVLISAPARTATGVQVFLNRALQDHAWGNFVAHISLQGEDNRMTAHIKDDIRRGVEAGDYRVQSVDAAADLLIGTKIEAIRRITAGGKDEAYIREVATMILRAFNTSTVDAPEIVEAMAQRLKNEGPTMLAWWKQGRIARQAES